MDKSQHQLQVIARALDGVRPLALRAREMAKTIEVSPIDDEATAAMREAQQSDAAAMLQRITAMTSPIRDHMTRCRDALAAVRSVTDPIQERVREAQRVLGAWRARERVKLAAAAAAAAATANPVKILDNPPPPPRKGTRTRWVVEITDPELLRQSLIRLVMHPPAAMQQPDVMREEVAAAVQGLQVEGLIVHPPGVRKHVRSKLGAHVIDMCRLEGVKVRREEVATIVK